MNIENINFNNLNDYLLEENTGNWIITSILYASYNCILLIPVLISMKDYIAKSKNIKYISIIVTLITIILLSIIFLFLINIDVDIHNLEMPAVYAINMMYPKFKGIYGLIILISIFTTSISLGMSFIKNVAKDNGKFDKIAFLICATGIIFSKIGFANLVNLLYPILGVLGLVQIIQVLINK